MGTWEFLVAWLSLLSSALPGWGPGSLCCYAAVPHFPCCFSLLSGELNLVLEFGENKFSPCFGERVVLVREIFISGKAVTRSKNLLLSFPFLLSEERSVRAGVCLGC